MINFNKIHTKDMNTTEPREEATDFLFLHECDHNCIGDALIDKPIEEVNAEIEQVLKLMADGEELPEANFIVDVFMLHTNSQLTVRPEHLLIQGVKHMHDAFRNRNEFYRPDGIDTKMNFSVGNIYYINGEEVWGDIFRTGGIAYSGTQGVNFAVAMDYCKQYAGTVGDGSRYALLAPWRISTADSVNNIGGFAYVGSHLHTRLAGQWSRSTSLGSNFSKTPIHEMGHSAALWHTFHATNNCGPEANPLLNGDRVPETPPETRNNTDPCFNINAPNHMSYGSHNGRWYFVLGQMVRMRAWIIAGAQETLSNPRVYWPDEEVPTPLPVPTIELTLSSNEITKGEYIDITWKVENADDIELVGFGQVDAEGSQRITPEESDSVTIIASNKDHVKTKTKEFIVHEEVDRTAPDVTIEEFHNRIVVTLNGEYDDPRIRIRNRSNGWAGTRKFNNENPRTVWKNGIAGGPGRYALRVRARVGENDFTEYTIPYMFNIY